ncbi:MAG TPA: hypothetical protein VGB76_16940 [Pyrinomonadaceae bacterium]|jgi:hypothetical protein
MVLLDSRISSVTRRAASLAAEIEQWLCYAEQGNVFEKNSSQLEALDIFMARVTAQLKNDSSAISGSMRPEPSNAADILHKIEAIERELFEGYFIWAYFRSKLEQRFVPQFADALLTTDLVSYNCYRTTLDNANRLGIEHKLGLRDYPLTYFLEDYPSPMTWPRDVRQRGLAGRTLAVPVIGIPWDHIATPWEWLSLNHEVAHAIDYDLGIPSKELSGHLQGKSDRASVWQLWMSEIFADALAILLAGPAFVSYLANSLTVPGDKATSLAKVGLHPPPYLRVVLNVQLAQDLIPGRMVQNYVSNLLNQWEQIYGKQQSGLSDYLNDLDDIMRVLKTNLNTLKDGQGVAHSLMELIGFGESDFENQLAGRDQFLAGGEVVNHMSLRHVLGAAYMATEEHINSHGSLDSRFADGLAIRIKAAIKVKAPAGQLPLRTEASKRYLRDLADAFLADSIAGGINDQQIS